MCLLRDSIVAAVLVASLHGSEPVRAQDVAVPPGKKPPRTVRLASVAMPDGLENPLWVRDRGKHVEVHLSRGVSSGAIRIPASGKFELLRETESTEEGDERTFIPVAVADLSAGVRDALLILVPRPEPDLNRPGGVYRVVVRDLRAFKGGQYLFLNFARAPVAVDFGGRRRAIGPGGSWIVRGAGTDGEAVNIPVAYFRSEGEAPDQRWKRISASTLVAYPTRREICLFYSHRDRVRYAGITVPVQEP